MAGSANCLLVTDRDTSGLDTLLVGLDGVDQSALNPGRLRATLFPTNDRTNQLDSTIMRMGKIW